MVSESERKKRRESNRFSTKINFSVWFIEVITLNFHWSDNLKLQSFQVFPRGPLKKWLFRLHAFFSAFGCPFCYSTPSSEQRGKNDWMGIHVHNGKHTFLGPQGPQLLEYLWFLSSRPCAKNLNQCLLGPQPTCRPRSSANGAYHCKRTSVVSWQL